LAGCEPGPDAGPAATAEAIVAFWRAAGPRRWFAKDPAFDGSIRNRFERTRVTAARGDLDGWRGHATGALALILLLDQFPRNLFRGTSQAFATDAMARAVAREALADGHDQATETDLRLFFYLPFSHSEAMEDQDLAVARGEVLEHVGGASAESAREHRDIIRRFGRFPHRNRALGRATTPEEQLFLTNGGFAG